MSKSLKDIKNIILHYVNTTQNFNFQIELCENITDQSINLNIFTLY